MTMTSTGKTNQPMLQIESLGKRYKKDFWGLKEFTLSLNPCVLGLLGPNGAGKSTLMRMLATITRPTEGEVHWKGTNVVKHPEALRTQLGYLPQDFGVYPNLTAIEFLEYMAAVKGLSGKNARQKVEELVDLLNLRDAARRPMGGYSGGMRQRVGIAQALLNDPQLLIVDEPTVGLDPEERVRFRNLLSDLAGERIVILSTHIVSDVESTATDLALIHHGKLVTHSDPGKLLQQFEDCVWEWVVTLDELSMLHERFFISNTMRKNGGVQVRVINKGQPHRDARSVSPNLEDVYLSLVRQEV